MSDLEKTLASRNASYGDYKLGVVLRVKLMKMITDRHIQVHGKKMNHFDESKISDVVNKLTRVAVSPDHLDSWRDIAGYSKLIMKEIQSAYKQESKGPEKPSQRQTTRKSYDEVHGTSDKRSSGASKPLKYGDPDRLHTEVGNCNME